MNKLLFNLHALLHTYRHDQRGVTAIEYGLIGVAMAAVVASVFSSEGSILQSLTNAFDAIGTELGSVNDAAGVGGGETAQ